MSANNNLKRLGITLPAVSKPVANYLPAVAAPIGGGKAMAFISGQVSRNLDTGELMCGKVGKDASAEQAAQAARSCGLQILAALQDCAGDLDKVESTLSITCLVNAAPDFTDHPKVANGCSDLMVEVLGDAHGKHSRAAFGAGSLPANVMVEITAVFMINV